MKDYIFTCCVFGSGPLCVLLRHCYTQHTKSRKLSSKQCLLLPSALTSFPLCLSYNKGGVTVERGWAVYLVPEAAFFSLFLYILTTCYYPAFSFSSSAWFSSICWLIVTYHISNRLSEGHVVYEIQMRMPKRRKVITLHARRRWWQWR